MHRSIGAIYLSLGSLGEELTGKVFTSAEVMALCNKPVDSAAGRAVAQMETDYWNKETDPNSFGGRWGRSVTADERFERLKCMAGCSSDCPWYKGLLLALKLGWRAVPATLGALVTSVIGDPHLRTFDGCRFDFQGAGEFVLASTLDGEMAIHARFVPQRRWPTATMMGAVAVRGFALSVASRHGATLQDDRCIVKWRAN